MDSRGAEELNQGHYGCGSDQFFRIDPNDSDTMLVQRLLADHVSRDQDGLFRDGVTDRSLPFNEESDGTQQLLHYLPFLFVPRDESKVVVIDELDRSLHPLLCWELIRLFSEWCPGMRRQLIVTTHEAHLLDQDLLRRDEYWFVAKDDRQQSQLTSLSGYKVRNDLQLRKSYLRGRFGGIPVFGGMQAVRELLDCDEREGTGAEEAPAAST